MRFAVLNSVIDSIVQLRVLKFLARCAYRVGCQLVVDTKCTNYVLDDFV